MLKLLPERWVHNFYVRTVCETCTDFAHLHSDSTRYPELGYTPCEDGFAAAIPGDFNNTFKCHNVGQFEPKIVLNLLICED
jgi:hypothetical protein